MKKNRQFQLAIIGCGKVAHLHARAIPRIYRMRLLRSLEPDKGEGQNFAILHETTAYGNISEMIKTAKIDLVIVCTPHPFHREPAVEAARAGANVLVEKPLASSLEDSDLIIKACKEAGVRLGVVSQRRWYAPVLRNEKSHQQG